MAITASPSIDLGSTDTLRLRADGRRRDQEQTAQASGSSIGNRLNSDRSTDQRASPSPRPNSIIPSSSPNLSRHSSSSNSPRIPGDATPPSPRLRRKPVPNLHIMPGRDLPASHPFANSQPSPNTRNSNANGGSGSSRTGGTLRTDSPAGLYTPGTNGSGSEPNTPGFPDEKDLFYRPPGSPGVGGPVPPWRAASHSRGASTASSPTVGGSRSVGGGVTEGHADRSGKEGGARSSSGTHTPPAEALEERRGTFHGGLNITIPSSTASATPPSQSRVVSSVVGAPERAGEISVDSHSDDSDDEADAGPSTPPANKSSSAKSSPLPTDLAYYNRSLPALPANASSVSLGMMSVLETGPLRNNSTVINQSPNVAKDTGNRNASVDSAMTGFSSLESPVHMGGSTTSLGMFSFLEQGPDGQRRTKKGRELDRAEAEANQGKLGVYSPSLMSGSQSQTRQGNGKGLNKKLSRRSFFSSNKNSPKRAVSSAPMSPVEEDEEAAEDEDDAGFSISRPPHKRKVWEAGQTYVRDETGAMIKFADLFPAWDGDSSAEPKRIPKAQYQAMMASAGLTASLPARSSFSAQNEQYLRDIRAASAHSASPGIRSVSRMSKPSTLSGGGGTDGEAPPSGVTEIPAEATINEGGPTGEVRPQPKSVLFFIRTFWCGQCQDYTLASIARIDQEALRRANIRLVIISNGNWRHIKPYRALFKCPFPIYVDASRKLYKLMGMTRSTINPGPMFSGRASYHQKSVPMQWAGSMVTAAVKLPKVNPGNVFQLGGEFVVTPGYECSFAHRMTNLSNHMEAADVLRIAGIDEPIREEAEPVQLQPAQIVEAERLAVADADWRAKRDATLEAMARKKARVTGRPYVPYRDGDNNTVSPTHRFAELQADEYDTANEEMENEDQLKHGDDEGVKGGAVDVGDTALESTASVDRFYTPNATATTLDLGNGHSASASANTSAPLEVIVQDSATSPPAAVTASTTTTARSTGGRTRNDSVNGGESLYGHSDGPGTGIALEDVLGDAELARRYEEAMMLGEGGIEIGEGKK